MIVCVTHGLVIKRFLDLVGLSLPDGFPSYTETHVGSYAWWQRTNPTQAKDGAALYVRTLHGHDTLMDGTGPYVNANEPRLDGPSDQA